MRAELTVSIRDRVLILEGRLSEDAFLSIRKGLPASAVARECCFSQYSYADLPLPKVFEVVFDYASPKRAEFMPISIYAVTQQFGHPDTQIPHGWKMICWLGRSGETSTLLAELPEVSTWFQGERTIGLASIETWKMLI